MRFHEVVITGPGQVEVRPGELDLSTIGPHQVVIETECSVISAGTELANYTGTEPRVFEKGSWCAYPWRPGYGNVGIVRAAGQSVTNARVGERVFTFAEHSSLVCYSDEKLIFPVPAGMDPALAAATRMAGVSITALLVSTLENDPWVVVFGLGMVGNLAAQIFRLRGCRVIGVDPLSARRELARRCGIGQTIGGEGDQVTEQIRRITGGALGDIVVESVGHSAVALQAVGATAALGQLVLLGSPRAPVRTNLTEFLSDVHLRGIRVQGALEWRWPTYPDPFGRLSHFTKFEMIFAWIQRGLLQLEPLISHRLPPTRIVEAYNGLRDRPEVFTGVVLDWRQP